MLHSSKQVVIRRRGVWVEYNHVALEMKIPSEHFYSICRKCFIIENMVNADSATCTAHSSLLSCFISSPWILNRFKFWRQNKLERGEKSGSSLYLLCFGFWRRVRRDYTFHTSCTSSKNKNLRCVF